VTNQPAGTVLAVQLHLGAVGLEEPGGTGHRSVDDPVDVDIVQRVGGGGESLPGLPVVAAS
jgi:hypothetical protein